MRRHAIQLSARWGGRGLLVSPKPCMRDGRRCAAAGFAQKSDGGARAFLVARFWLCGAVSRYVVSRNGLRLHWLVGSGALNYAPVLCSAGPQGFRAGSCVTLGRRLAQAAEHGREMSARRCSWHLVCDRRASSQYRRRSVNVNVPSISCDRGLAGGL